MKEETVELYADDCHFNKIEDKLIKYLPALTFHKKSIYLNLKTTNKRILFSSS